MIGDDEARNKGEPNWVKQRLSKGDVKANSKERVLAGLALGVHAVHCS
jgi:hypothetical protein